MRNCARTRCGAFRWVVTTLKAVLIASSSGPEGHLSTDVQHVDAGLDAQYSRTGTCLIRDALDGLYAAARTPANFGDKRSGYRRVGNLSRY